jgi:FlaA1/EpsC-like NDP-sugar epimerase
MTESERSQSAWLTYRRVFIVMVHLALWAAGYLGAYLLRFEFRPNELYLRMAAETLPMLLALRLATFWQQKLFRGLWRYTGSKDLTGIFFATTAATLFFVLGCTLLGYRGVPRSIFVIEWLLAMMSIGGVRFAIRKLRELSLQVQSNADRHNVLIVGAGDAGEMLVREIQKTHARRYRAIGFVDDNPNKHGVIIHGVRVLGPIEEVSDIVASNDVEEVIIAIPTASGREMRRIVELCKPAGVHLRTIPGLDSLIDGHVRVTQLRDVAIEDLLGREAVQLDTDAIKSFLTDEVVLVTGAGGSIGSEMCRQIARFKPARLVLVEQNENALFNVHRELAADYPDLKLIPAIADITDETRVDALFSKLNPRVVLHAAAHKHVPMMEWNPGEAVKNNVVGTRVVADVAHRHGVDRFVMISTDKAVNPTSVMGATKRVAELYIQAMSKRSETHFITVRFGNVLGSSGSVIPIFREQIQRGGPVTVTHPEMKRYFMTIPEACQLVLQAGTMGEGGEIFILDMGEPVKIVDLAHDLIVLSGLKPGDDIEIDFTGVRPGEKLFEELHVDGEDADKTRHPKIYVGRTTPREWGELERGVEGLSGYSDGKAPRQVRGALRKLVPEYTPDARTAVDEPTPVREAPVIPLRR